MAWQTKLSFFILFPVSSFLNGVKERQENNLDKAIPATNSGEEYKMVLFHLCKL